MNKIWGEVNLLSQPDVGSGMSKYSSVSQVIVYSVSPPGNTDSGSVH